MTYYSQRSSKKDFDRLFDDADDVTMSKSGADYRNYGTPMVASLADLDVNSQSTSLLVSSVSVSISASSATAHLVKSKTIKGTKVSPMKSKLFLAMFLCLFFIGAAIFSIPAPFFPSRAMEKGVSQTMAGLILGSMQLVQFFAAVTFSMTMFHFGVKFMLCWGIFWAGSCSILFGILDLGPNDSSYPTLCFIVRIIQGLGVSSYYISCSTMIAVLFSENYGFTTGMLQTSYSLGCLFGPTIGGLLYGVGGYIFPFIIMGVLLMVFAPLIAVIVPSTLVTSSAAAGGHDSQVKVFRTMLTPSLAALFYTMLVSTMTTVFTETTLGVRLQDFGITDPLLVGCVYLSSSGAYGVTAPLAGKLADKFDMGWLVMLIGTCLSIIGYLLLGPSPIFGMEASLTQTIIGSFIAHCGISAVMIPTTRELQRLAKYNGLEREDPSTLSFISAFFDSCWGMGGFLGAFIAGTLMENLGFPLATSIQALVLVPSLFMQIYLIYHFGHIHYLFTRNEGYEEI